MRRNELTEEQRNRFAEWMLNNAIATASDIRGVSPLSMGYEVSDLSKIQIAFNIEHGTDEIKLFYQRKKDSKGRTFEIKSIDDGLFEIMDSYLSYVRTSRREQETSIDSILFDKPKKSRFAHLEDDEDYK